MAGDVVVIMDSLVLCGSLPQSFGGLEVKLQPKATLLRDL